MNQTCPTCGQASSGPSRFCSACGMTLGATTVENRTVILSQSAASLTARGPDTSSVAQATHLIMSQGRLPGLSNAVTGPLDDQREHTIFVQDISGSMSGQYDQRFNKLEASQRATCSTVVEKERLDDQDEIGLVAFNSSASEVLPLCQIATHKHQILTSIQSLQVNGGTDINRGLKAARDMFDWNRHDVVRRIVLLTDGHGGHPLATADDLKQRGVVIEVVGVGDDPSNVDEALLKKVASVIEGEVGYRFIKDSETLVDHFTRLANKTKVDN